MGIEDHPPSLDLGTEDYVLGMDRNYMLPVSPSGRFMAFVRGKFNESTVSKTNTDWVEFSVLDLQTGRQSILRKISGEDCEKRYRKFTTVPTMRSFYMECKTLWAKDRDRLGISFGPMIYLFDFPAGGTVSDGKPASAAPLFVPAGEISLPGDWGCDFDYWDANTLLVKNYWGLYKIDIAKACGKKPKI